MTIRMFAATALVLLFDRAALAQLRETTVMEGDQIAVRMTGDLAREYARATAVGRATKPAHGLQIETMATVEQRLADGRIRIEHSSTLEQQGEAPRLVTLTATIAASKVTTHVSPKGTKVYASPGSKDAKVTTEQTEMLRIALSDLKGLKLRTWTLSSEIGQ